MSLARGIRYLAVSGSFIYIKEVDDFKRLNIRVSDEMNEYLDMKAQKTGLTKNAIVIMALEMYVQQQTVMPHIPDMLRELRGDNDKN